MLQAEVVSRKQEVEALQTANKEMSDRLIQAEQKIKDSEQYSRRDNLMITGLSASVAEIAAASGSDGTNGQSPQSTRNKVLDFCHDNLNLDLDQTDISTTHFIKSKNAASSKQVLVRFTNHTARDQVFYSKGKLRDIHDGKSTQEKYFINEDLTENNRKLFGAAQDKFKRKLVLSAWTSNGRIYVKTADGTIHTITTIAQLNYVARP